MLYWFRCSLLFCTLLSCYVLFVFFFFKQKTAYEMRISDWSSDVCSSDLLLLHIPIRRLRGVGADPPLASEGFCGLPLLPLRLSVCLLAFAFFYSGRSEIFNDAARAIAPPRQRCRAH